MPCPELKLDLASPAQNLFFCSVFPCQLMVFSSFQTWRHYQLLFLSCIIYSSSESLVGCIFQMFWETDKFSPLPLLPPWSKTTLLSHFFKPLFIYLFFFQLRSRDKVRSQYSSQIPVVTSHFIQNSYNSYEASKHFPSLPVITLPCFLAIFSLTPLASAAVILLFQDCTLLWLTPLFC